MSDGNDPVKGSSGPKLCANGCGFFGNSAFSNMCSQCYKATHPDQSSPTLAPSSRPTSEAPPVSMLPVAAAAPVAVVAAAAPSVSVTATPSAVAAGAPSGTPPKKEKKSKKKKKNRCTSCRKKVGLTGFVCRCGDVFCDTHRYADAHSCSHDYQSEHKSLLEKLNPKVVASKVDQL